VVCARRRVSSFGDSTLASFALLLFATEAHAGGSFKLKSTQVQEVSGAWHLFVTIELPKAPAVPHVPMKFILTKTAVYERALKRIWKALFYSLDGLAAAFKHEEAFRLEVLLALILVPIALHMPVSGVGKALLVGSVLLVLIAELLNSAIEAVTDRISLEEHVLAKRAKDFGSAAVMLSVISVPVVWLLVLVG